MSLPASYEAWGTVLLIAVFVGLAGKWMLRSGAPALLMLAACVVGVLIGPYFFMLAGVTPVIVFEGIDVIAGLAGAALFAVVVRLIGGQGGL